MGNVQVLAQNNNGQLTEFQRNKILFDFNTFFDLNNDGYLSYKVVILQFDVSSLCSCFCSRIFNGLKIEYARCQGGRWTVPSINPLKSCFPTFGRV